MSRPTLQNIRGLADFATLYEWDLAFTAVPAGLTINTDDVNFRCLSSTVPKMATPSAPVNIRGHQVNYNTVATYDGTITLSFVETIDNKISLIGKAWRDLIWQPNTGKQASKADCQAEIILTRMDRSNNPIWAYKLIGCILTAYDPGGDFADSGDVVKPTFTLQYDMFIDGPPDQINASLPTS